MKLNDEQQNQAYCKRQYEECPIPKLSLNRRLCDFATALARAPAHKKNATTAF
jgi:hypothetical protein